MEFMDIVKDVIVINYKGIGFLRIGWKGLFKNVWGINGVLNVDFIGVGKIKFNIFEILFNSCGDILCMVNGIL